MPSSSSIKDNNDPTEIAKFEQMAKTWWDIKGKCGPLHAINPLRLKFIKERVPLFRKTAIDIGCGGGILTEALASEGAKVTGIDKSQALIEVAKSHAAHNHLVINYIISDAESFCKKHQQTFDLVCCMELLEHVPHPESLIRACSSLAKPGAWVFFSSINRNIYAYLLAIIAAEYLLKLLPRGTHHYKKFIRPSELSKIARQAGLSLKKIQGIRYNPLIHQFVLTKDIRVNYLLAFQKPF